ncbi:MAG: HNH endonuclease [Hyphomicrobiaceae bacterium]
MKPNRDQLYGRRWKAARLAFLGEHPLCAYCLARDRTTLATVVDHIVPHRGDPELFWRQNNWQPLCLICHDAIKQAEEKGGHMRGCDVNGVPLDPSHPWAREAAG